MIQGIIAEPRGTVGPLAANNLLTEDDQPLLTEDDQPLLTES
jgi:hypothetical protein